MRSEKEGPQELARIIAERAAAMEAWKHPVEILEPREEDEVIRDMSDRLAVILRFLAKGRLTGTMDIRTWVFIYETRLDFMEGDSIAQYAKRRGVSAQRIYELIREFRACVPAYHSPHRKTAEHVGRMRAAARARQKLPGGDLPPPPPGKESFTYPSGAPGSAHP